MPFQRVALFLVIHGGAHGIQENKMLLKPTRVYGKTGSKNHHICRLSLDLLLGQSAAKSSHGVNVSSWAERNLVQPDNSLACPPNPSQPKKSVSSLLDTARWAPPQALLLQWTVPVLYKYPTKATSQISTIYQTIQLLTEVHFTYFSIMNNKVSNIPQVTTSSNFRGRRPLPKRGQIKLRIAEKAFKSFVSVLSMASSPRHRSCQISYLRETKNISNYWSYQTLYHKYFLDVYSSFSSSSFFFQEEKKGAVQLHGLFLVQKILVEHNLEFYKIHDETWPKILCGSDGAMVINSKPIWCFPWFIY